MANSNHLASAETSELLSSSASDDDAVSVNFVSISDNIVRYKGRRSFPHEVEPGGVNDVKSSSAAGHSSMTLRAGPRYLLFTEGDVQVCRISPKSSISKVLRSQCLRQWENRHLILGGSDMSFHMVGIFVIFVVIIFVRIFVIFLIVFIIISSSSSSLHLLTF